MDEPSKLRVVMSGGGTGGHLYPALAIAEELRRRMVCRIFFIGTRHGLESRVVPSEGYEFRTIWIAGLRRNKIVENLLFPLKMAISLIQSALILGRFRPDGAVGTGGYVSWPVCTACVLMKIPTLIQEQNQKPGLVTRLLAPRVDSVHLSFEESKTHFRKKGHLHVSGNPTRNDLDQGSRKEAFEKFGLDPRRTTLFVFGGSQGSKKINETILNFYDRLEEKPDLQVLWSTGPRWFDEIQKKVQKRAARVRVFPYIEEIGLAYRVSDLVICRAGATTVAEVTRLGLPVIFIPFHASAGGHQEANARQLHQAGAAEMILESELESGVLEGVLFGLLNDRRRRVDMAIRAKRFGKPEAAKAIVDDLMTLIKPGGGH